MCFRQGYAGRGREGRRCRSEGNRFKIRFTDMGSGESKVEDVLCYGRKEIFRKGYVMVEKRG